MTARFVTNLLVLVCGAFLAAASFAFSARALGWVGLGMGCAVVLVVLIGFAIRGRGIAQRCIDALQFATGAFTVVAARVFHGATLHWLTLAEGATLAALAVIGLVIHEVYLQMAVARAPRGVPRDGTLHGAEHAPLGIN
jgi:hypothetical protein